MLRILLIIAVALAVVIGLQRLTSYRQGAVGPAAPAVAETTAEDQVPAGEVPPTSESMDVPATDVMDATLATGDEVNLEGLPAGLPEQTPGASAEPEIEAGLSDPALSDTPASSDGPAEPESEGPADPEAATNTDSAQPQ